MAERWDRARRTMREDGLKQVAGTYRASKQGVARRALNSSGSALLADPERVGLVEPDVPARIPGEVPFLGYVADFRSNDDGLANPVHRPDGEYLVGAGGEDLVPSLAAHRGVGRGLPLLQVVPQLAGRRHVALLAFRAFGLYEHAPAGPLKAALHGRRELLGAGVDSRHGRHDTGEGGHDRVTRKSPQSEILTGLRLGQHLDADLLPEFADQMQSICVFGLLARMFDHDDCRSTIGQQADAVGATLVQANLVEELVREFWIVFRPLGRVFGLEQLRALHDRVVGGFGQA